VLVTLSVSEEALYRVTDLWTVEPPEPCTSSWVGWFTNSGALEGLPDVLPGIWRAA
jgi:hypothetical protein